MMERIECERCNYRGKPRFDYDGWGNYYLSCPECGASEKDLKEVKS